MTESDGQGRVPADSFRIRLAIVRTEMGWNYDQAQAATGVSSESWRQWEKGLRHCTHIIDVAQRIAEVTGYDASWLALGGPLSPGEVQRTGAPSIKRSTNEHLRGCSVSTRQRVVRRGATCGIVLAA